jgi:hypothetical protein
MWLLKSPLPGKPHSLPMVPLNRKNVSEYNDNVEKRDAPGLKIHCGFIAIANNAVMHAHPCAARRANPSRGGRYRALEEDEHGP